MNARQKAKYYKKMYERTRYNVKPEFKMFNGSTVRLKCKKSVPREVLSDTSAMGLTIKEKIKRELVYDLADELVKYMYFDIEPSQSPYMVGFVGSIEVVTWS